RFCSASPSRHLTKTTSSRIRRPDKTVSFSCLPASRPSNWRNSAGIGSMIPSGSARCVRRLPSPAQPLLAPADSSSPDRPMAKEEHAHLYLGRSGQFAVMSELLYRRRNTAIPEVDVGDDVFVVRDKDDIVTRVQVKSANATAQHGGYFAQFSIPLLQLKKTDPPLFVYIFPVR